MYCGYGFSSCATVIVGSPSDDERGMMPKYGLATRCQQRVTQRELLDRELIEVRVGNADVRDLRADVRDLDRRVRRQLALHRDVPLLHVAGAERGVDGEDALSEAGRRRRRDRRHASGRSAARTPGMTVSSVRCVTVWRNGNVGVVNGVVMPAISIQTRP